MAFFDEEVNKLSLRKIPDSVSTCLRPDGMSQMLWQWAKNIENWGRVACLILVGYGFFVMMSTGMSIYDELEYDDNSGLLTLLAVLSVALQWGFYSFVEYCVYHALSQLMGALASIVQSNRISSDLALYHASLNSDRYINKEPIQAEIDDQKIQATEVTYQCPKCGKTIQFFDTICECGQRFDWSNL